MSRLYRRLLPFLQSLSVPAYSVVASQKNCRVYNENDPKLIDIEDRGRFLYEKEVIVEKEYRSINADAARLRTEFKELCENPPAAPEKNYERLSIAVQERKRLEAKLAEEL